MFLRGSIKNLKHTNMVNLITLLSNHSCIYFGFRVLFWGDREMTVGRVLTCTADALVLCSLPVTSPRCLQGQSWDTKRRETRLDLCISMLVWNRSWTFLIFRPKVYCNVGCCLPISGFFASSASSVLKRVFGKRMKIFDLSKCDSSFINSLMVNYLLLLQDCYQTLIPPLSRLLSSPPSNTLPS